MNDCQIIEQALIDYQDLLNSLSGCGFVNLRLDSRLNEAYDALENLNNPIKEKKREPKHE